MTPKDYHVLVPLAGPPQPERILNRNRLLHPFLEQYNCLYTFLISEEEKGSWQKEITDALPERSGENARRDAFFWVKHDWEKTFHTVYSILPIDMVMTGFEDQPMSQSQNLPWDRYLIGKKIPLLALSNKQVAEHVHNVVLPVALSDDYTDIIRKAIKLFKPFQKVTLHLVSIFFQAEVFTLHKASQQLGTINRFFADNGLPYSAEIIHCVSRGETKAQLVSEHVRRVKGDLVLLFRFQALHELELNPTDKMSAILMESPVPVVCFH